MLTIITFTLTWTSRQKQWKEQKQSFCRSLIERKWKKNANNTNKHVTKWFNYQTTWMLNGNNNINKTHSQNNSCIPKQKNSLQNKRIERKNIMLFGWHSIYNQWKIISCWIICHQKIFFIYATNNLLWWWWWSVEFQIQKNTINNERCVRCECVCVCVKQKFISYFIYLFIFILSLKQKSEWKKWLIHTHTHTQKQKKRIRTIFNTFSFSLHLYHIECMIHLKFFFLFLD